MSKASHFYPRSLVLVITIALVLLFALSGARLTTWSALLPFFEWMETTTFGVIGQTWGAAFATVQAFHLLAMAVLGGVVLTADAQLLGWAFRDTPIRDLQQQCHRLFVISLLVVVLTGIFMACGVAIKIYYLQVFWYKMLALAVGVAFVYGIRRPLVRNIEQVNPAVLKITAVASTMTWFTVAATGRWIGFSG